MKLVALMLGLAFLLNCTACESQARRARTEGTSYATAILIGAATQDEGVREEYTWLKRNFPDARQTEVEKVGEEEVVFGHHTDSHEGRFFSVHTLILRDGKIRPVYFDITSYFGKTR